MSGIKDYSTTPASNNAAPPNGFPEGMAPASLNDGMRQVMADIRSWYEDPAWIDFGDVPTRTGANTFTIPTDKTARYTAGARIKMTGTTPFTLFGTISTSSYSAPNTTVTVSMDSGSLDATLNSVSLNMVQKSISGLSLNTATITTITSTTANISAVNVTGGTLSISGTSSEAGKITLEEDTDNGTNKVILQAPSSIASDYTLTLPSSAGTLALTTEIYGSGTKLYQTTGTSITTGTWTSVLYDTEEWDDNNWHSTSSNTDRITVDFTGRISVYGLYDSNSTTVRFCGVRFKKNGTVFATMTDRRSDDTAFDTFRVGLYAETSVAPSDYITMEVYQSSGGNLTTGSGIANTQFAARRIK